jgi:hypothetical protein
MADIWDMYLSVFPRINSAAEVTGWEINSRISNINRGHSSKRALTMLKAWSRSFEANSQSPVEAAELPHRIKVRKGIPFAAFILYASDWIAFRGDWQ